jgi:hypothetical protein
MPSSTRLCSYESLIENCPAPSARHSGNDFRKIAPLSARNVEIQKSRKSMLVRCEPGDTFVSSDS